MQTQTSTENLTDPILVMALGVDTYSQIALRTAFLLHKNVSYQLRNDGNPDLIIIDLDDHAIKQTLQECQNDYPDIPLLAICSELPEQNSAYFALQKPVTVETLFPAIDQLLTQEISNESADKVEAEISEPSAPTSYEYESLKSAPILRHIERCNLNAGLLGQALRHYRKKENIIFGDGQDPSLILLSAEHLFLLLKPLQHIKTICQSDNKLPIQILSTDHPPLPGVRIKTQALLWQMALWSANGRLIVNISPDTPLKLRHWPNLTRLAQTPDAIRLSAFITQNTTNLRAINRTLGIPLPHIMDFIAATYAIGLLGKSTESSNQIDAESASQTNIFSKIFRKVKLT